MKDNSFIICPHCGHHNSPDSTRCLVCHDSLVGQPVVNPAAENAAKPDAATETSKPKYVPTKTVGTKILMALMVVVIVVYLVYYFFAISILFGADFSDLTAIYQPCYYGSLYLLGLISVLNAILNKQKIASRVGFFGAGIVEMMIMTHHLILVDQYPILYDAMIACMIAFFVVSLIGVMKEKENGNKGIARFSFQLFVTSIIIEIVSPVILLIFMGLVLM